MKNPGDVCVQCGETRAAIRLNEQYCMIMNGGGEDPAEVSHEYPRHRFKPYSEKELAAQNRDYEEFIKQLGEMDEFFRKEIEIEEAEKLQKS